MKRLLPLLMLLFCFGASEPIEDQQIVMTVRAYIKLELLTAQQAYYGALFHKSLNEVTNSIVTNTMAGLRNKFP